MARSLRSGRTLSSPPPTPSTAKKAKATKDAPTPRPKRGAKSDAPTETPKKAPIRKGGLKTPKPSSRKRQIREETPGSGEGVEAAEVATETTQAKAPANAQPDAKSGAPKETAKKAKKAPDEKGGGKITPKPSRRGRQAGEESLESAEVVQAAEAETGTAKAVGAASAKPDAKSGEPKETAKKAGRKRSSSKKRRSREQSSEREEVVDAAEVKTETPKAMVATDAKPDAKSGAPKETAEKAKKTPNNKGGDKTTPKLSSTKSEEVVKVVEVETKMPEVVAHVNAKPDAKSGAPKETRKKAKKTPSKKGGDKTTSKLSSKKSEEVVDGAEVETKTTKALDPASAKADAKSVVPEETANKAKKTPKKKGSGQTTPKASSTKSEEVVVAAEFETKTTKAVAPSSAKSAAKSGDPEETGKKAKKTPNKQGGGKTTPKRSSKKSKTIVEAAEVETKTTQAVASASAEPDAKSGVPEETGKKAKKTLNTKGGGKTTPKRSSKKNEEVIEVAEVETKMTQVVADASAKPDAKSGAPEGTGKKAKKTPTRKRGGKNTPKRSSKKSEEVVEAAEVETEMTPLVAAASAKPDATSGEPEGTGKKAKRTPSTKVGGKTTPKRSTKKSKAVVEAVEVETEMTKAVAVASTNLDVTSGTPEETGKKGKNTPNTKGDGKTTPKRSSKKSEEVVEAAEVKTETTQAVTVASTNPDVKSGAPEETGKKAKKTPIKKGGVKTTPKRSSRKRRTREDSSESEDVVEAVEAETEKTKAMAAANAKPDAKGGAPKEIVSKVKKTPDTKGGVKTTAKSAAPSPMKKLKKLAEKEDGSSPDESDGDEVEKVAPVPLKMSGAAMKKDENSSDEEDDEDSENEDSSTGGGPGEENDEKTGFTDENSNWLKPKRDKMKLMSSDEEGDDDDDEFDVAASDDDEMLDIERQSRLLDAETRLEQEEAESDLRRTIASETSIYLLPTDEELEEEEAGMRVVPPSELRARVEDVLEVLASFRARRQPGKGRSDYVERLGKDMAELFGYLPELVEYFLSMFGPNECLEFLEASEKSRPLVVRTNTLKARRKDLAAALMKRGVRLDPLATWSKVGLKIHESAVPVGATPEYLAGHYMLQSAASMCPVMALGCQPGDRVLDMSSAPGGKTSYMSQLMRNKGVIIANDLKPARQKATVANLHRLGARNVVTCCYDGRKIGSLMRNSFDRILLDAPCSGLGVVSRDPSVKVQRTMPDVRRCAHLQKELLVASIDALNHKSKKGGGYMVYSTCSVAVAENEEVVNYLLSKRDVKLVDAGLDFGKPGFTRFEHKRFHPSVALTRRFYPHVHNMDGFYVAKIQKLSDKRKGEEEDKEEQVDKDSNEVEADDATKVNVAGSEKKIATKVNEAGSEKKMEGGIQRQGTKKKKRQKGKKRRGKESADADGVGDNGQGAQKKSKISYAPHAQQMQTTQKKKKTNAKVTKPRRMKITGM